MTEVFYNELKAHLGQFRSSADLPEIKFRGPGFRVEGDSQPAPRGMKEPVIITGIPRVGLTVKYQHPSEGSVDPVEMAKEAARFVGAVGGGTVGGAAVGAIIGKVVLGGTLAKVGVASAGVGIGVPVLAPVALAGGALAAAGFAAHKVGSRRKHDREQEYMNSLIEHMEWFDPSCGWPGIEMYVSVPCKGLTALWQPNLSPSQGDK